jgi:hypothetical protein
MQSQHVALPPEKRPPPRASALALLPEVPCTLIADYVGDTAQVAALSLASRAWAERVGDSVAWERAVARRCPATHRDHLAAFNRRAADGGFGAPVHWRTELHALMRRRLGAVDGRSAGVDGGVAAAVPRWLKPATWFRNAQQNVVCLGVDGAGATTLLYKLTRGAGGTYPIADIGFAVETVEVSTTCMRITVLPLRFQQRMLPLLQQYYATCAGLILVVDAAAADDDDGEYGWNLVASRLREAISGDMGYPPGLPLLVLANKQDKPGAAVPAVVAERLRMGELRRPWRVQGCIAERGDGLLDALSWLRDETRR